MRGDCFMLVVPLCVLGACHQRPYSIAENNGVSMVSDPPPSVVQPDYSQWRQLRIGMSESEVSALLGRPIEEHNLPEEFTSPGALHRWEYGHIFFDSYTMRCSYGFEVVFNRDGEVFEVWDPFDGQFSTDGSPTVPSPLLPRPGYELDHYPRFVDIRWQPSSGDYPMRYQLQISVDVHTSLHTTTSMYTTTIELNTCYYPYVHPGKNPGR